MRLSQFQIEVYYATLEMLLHYVGLQLNIFNKTINFEAFLEIDLQIKSECLNKLLNNKYLLNEFLFEFENKITNTQKEVLLGLKNSITSKFIIYKLEKKNGIFIDLDSKKVYKVDSIYNQFNDFSSVYPVAVQCSILPFMSHTICEGLSLLIANNKFDADVLTNLEIVYQIAKNNNQILKL
jgi:hypothetical protein